MEHILFYWDDIMACLIDEVIEEEVIELNKVEATKRGKQETAKLAHRSTYGKFHDYKNVKFITFKLNLHHQYLAYQKL